MLEVAFKALLTFNFKAKSADDKKQARENCVSQLNRIATMFFFFFMTGWIPISHTDWMARQTKCYVIYCKFEND